MRAARMAVLLVVACRASPPSSPPPAKPDGQAVSCVEQWLAQRDLNQYGDPAGTMYAGGTPLFVEDRFLTRARGLFYARIAFLVLGLGVIGVPGWSHSFGVGGRAAFAVYVAMVGYTAANYWLIGRPRLGRPVTFVTLCCDLCVLVWVVSMTGGLRSPLLAAQLLFTTLFVLLFPSPFAVVPPILTFPAVAKLDQLLGGRAVVQFDLFILLWYSAINCILVYLMVYLNERDRSRYRDLQRLHRTVREMAVVEERIGLAREIHDGLGGVL